MPRCWPGRCRTCHAACCWTLTNGRHCPVPSISARPHRRSPRRWSRPSAGLPNSAALLGVAAVTNLERKRCGGAFNTSWTSLKCIALCGQSRLYGPNHPKQKNVSNTQHAQAGAKTPRIGMLTNAFDPHSGFEAFRHGLRDLGYVEGRSIALEFRYAEGQAERLPALAAELVRLKVDLIFAEGVLAVQAVQHASGTIPI